MSFTKSSRITSDPLNFNALHELNISLAISIDILKHLDSSVKNSTSLIL